MVGSTARCGRFSSCTPGQKGQKGQQIFGQDTYL